ncbi:MAG: 30S ribosomal protein S12 methylthiotransferase RimO, partial [Bacteroidales bacterium]|nr:30S ribosomal protein S12 methylthiotransferase RimO [Bacteroidales bacterium]MDY6403151.1 30S ribosomal protein S12 methylthiotransferase RimO [Bacteroidales bacterium]
CSKNTVDSEGLAGELSKNGFIVEFDSQSTDFDYVLINTCGFIDKAKEESVNTILSYVSFRKAKRKKFNIIVFGCLAQRYKDDLQKEIPEIDKIFGLMQQKDIVSYIKQDSLSNTVIQRKLSTPKHYAYLKISEGCDRHCSFCAIPLIRGRHISRPIEDIVSEVKDLVKQGVKELILIAQDTSYYGLDLYKERKLYTLLEELCKTDIHWIRLQYSYPNQFPKEILNLMNKEKKICHYLDMPLQHINNRILESMNRNITDVEVKSLITEIRQKVPDIALRTTLIVGYPSEKKSEFLELKDFVEQVKFDRMGAFTYSKEEGTKAGKMRDSVPMKEKQRRLDELSALQQDISLSLNQDKIGKEFEVIIDRKEDDYYVGRTQYDSPEVDNEVLISVKNNKDLRVGEFYNVEISSAEDFDLYGDIK